MPYSHQYSMSSPSGAYAVRPGTSAALFARTIDATQRPPLVRAQETVAGALPQITDSFRTAFSSPFFLSALGLTLVVVWVLSRLRWRPAGLALGAMLMLALTSFRAPQMPTPKRVVDISQTPRTTRNRMQSKSWNGYGYIAPRPQEPMQEEPMPEPTPEVRDYAGPPESVTPDIIQSPEVNFDPGDIVLPATPMPALPQWSNDAIRNVQREVMRNAQLEVIRNVQREAHRLMRDPQVREIVTRIRGQALEQARQRIWRLDF